MVRIFHSGPLPAQVTRLRFPFLRLRGFIGPVLAVLVLAACDSAQPVPSGQSAASALRLQSCSTEQVEPGPAVGRAQCGELSVAENPDQPDGRQISLNILRLPAIASSPRPDPLFVLTGGPGEAATDLVERLPALFRTVNQDRDVVFVDQRGTGQSHPLDCVAEEPMDHSRTAQESLAAQEALLQECLASYDADLRFYTTPYAMDDLDNVRRAMGYQAINLWGGSYGTRAALVYMRRHPDSVRAAVLDGLAPTAIQLPHHALADGDKALRGLFALCEQEPACRQSFGDLESKTRKLITKLDAEPRQIRVEHPLTQEETQINVDGQLLAGLIRLALYQRDLGPVLPLAIQSATEGDFRPFALLLVLSQKVSEAISLGMQTTVLCAEDVMRPAPKERVGDASILQLELIESMQDVCAFWPRGELPDDYFEPVYSETPALLLSGELDPVTPPRWADLAGETLPNARHIRVPGTHHLSSNSGCLDDLIVSFIDAGTADELDTGCVEAVQPFPPFVSAAGPAMTRDNETVNDD